MINRMGLKYSLMLMVLFLAACSPGDNIPATAVPATVGAPGLPPAVVLDAQQWLATELNIPIEELQIVEMSQEQWSDSCLGLGGPNEICAQVITPGWRVIFEANGMRYEVRTDETGSTIRLASERGALVGATGLENTHWSLVFFGPPGAHTPLIEGSNVTLMLGNGEAGGFGGCNSYGTSYTIDGDRITFDRIRSTKKACLEDEITQQEQRYFQALESATRYELDASALRITFDGGDGVLVFEPPVPADLTPPAP